MAKPDNNHDSVDHATGADGSAAGKGRPTPSRKEREAANLRPLVSSDRKAAGKDARAKLAQSRERARVGMAAGEEKYLTARDKGPQRRWIRDYVDARFSVGEVLIPVMFIVIILTFVTTEALAALGLIILWVFFLAAVVDGIVLGMIVTRRLKEKFGPDALQRGNRWYAAMRAMQLRVMRLPKPQVKRWQFPA